MENQVTVTCWGLWVCIVCFRLCNVSREQAGRRLGSSVCFPEETREERRQQEPQFGSLWSDGYRPAGAWYKNTHTCHTRQTRYLSDNCIKNTPKGTNTTEPSRQLVDAASFQEAEHLKLSLNKVMWLHCKVSAGRQMFFLPFLLSNVAAVPPPGGRDGHLLERVDRWIPDGSDVSSATRGRGQDAEALQLQAK